MNLLKRKCERAIALGAMFIHCERNPLHEGKCRGGGWEWSYTDKPTKVKKNATSRS